MQPNPQVISAIPALLLSALETAGYSQRDLSRPLEVGSDGKWPVAEELWLWEEAARILDEPHLGLRLAH